MRIKMILKLYINLTEKTAVFVKDKDNQQKMKNNRIQGRDIKNKRMKT